MRDELRDKLRELRERYDDPYYWADHPTLRIVILSVASGIIGFMFLWAQLELRRRYQPSQAPPWVIEG